MIDIDVLKQINDNYGHIVGDKALKIVANAIQSSTRETDIVGRYGGEEFLIILPHTNQKQGYAITEKVRKSIETLEFEHDFKITICDRIAQYHQQPINELINHADRNMYCTKQ